jgi:hypothetical protein
MTTMGLASSDLGCCTGFFDQTTYGLAQLRALVLPVRHAIQLDAQTFSAFDCQRVVETDALDETAITTIAGIRHHHVVIRTILRTATRKTNDYHNDYPIEIDLANAKGREFYDISLNFGKDCLEKQISGAE